LDEQIRKQEPSRSEKPAAAPVSLILQRVAQTILQLGIAPLPRNYELVYEALSKPSSDLGRELAALGTAPPQAALDAIGLRRRLPCHMGLALYDAQATTLQAVALIASALSDEGLAKAKGLAALEAFLERLESDPVLSVSDLAQDARRLHEKLHRLSDRENRFAEQLEDSVALLGDAQARIEADRRTTLRDALTGLPNAAAFALRSAALFNAETAEISPAALVLVTVERLALLADRHGSDIGEKAVKKCAVLFRKSVKKSDVVARVGYDTFGFLLYDATDINAQTIAARIRDAVQSLEIRLPNRTFTAETLSLSAGIASTANVAGPQELLHQAETALTMVRTDGRQGILRCTPMMCTQIAKARPG
jgi:diguanylate cyclase